MNKRNILLSTILIGCLLLAILIKIGMFDKKGDRKIFTGKIDKFCINDYCVEKDGDRWWVVKDGNKKEAAPTVVQYYTDQFGKMNLAELVSENPNKLKDYGFNGDKKMILEINDKKVEIGSVGGSFTQTYVRNEKSSRVYTSDVTLDKNTISEMTYWINK